MPTYLYECETCGEFELSQPITAPSLDSCPSCGAPVRRLVAGGTGFIMKGQGAQRSGCERQTPCCGRAERCDTPPCGK